MPPAPCSRALVVTACAALVVHASGCGRLGFEAHYAPAPGDPRVRDSSAGDGSAIDAGADGSVAPGDPFDAGGTAPVDDSGTPANGDAAALPGDTDAGPSSDAGSTPEVPKPWPGGTFPSECSGAAAAGWLACMDFGGSSNGTPYVLNGTADTNAVSPGQSGAVALYTSAGAGAYAMSTADFTAQNQGTLYVRGYFYVVGGPVIDDVTLLSLEESGGGTQVIAIDIHPGDELALYHQASIQDFATGFTFPRNVWTCLTLQIDVGNSGAVTLAVDSVTTLTRAGIDLLPGDGVGYVSVGLPWTHDQQATVEVYADSVVVDDAPVDCL